MAPSTRSAAQNFLAQVEQFYLRESTKYNEENSMYRGVKVVRPGLTQVRDVLLNSMNIHENS